MAIRIPVRFVGRTSDDELPELLLVRLVPGKPAEPVAPLKDHSFSFDAATVKGATLGIVPADQPDAEPLMRFRADEVLPVWTRDSLQIPRERWFGWLQERICVSGRVRKCRPWWLDILPVARPKLGVVPRQPLARLGDLSDAIIRLPVRCLPLCDGVVEIHERHCCCQTFSLPDLLDRLRDVLGRIPVDIRWPEIRWPVPPIPDPGPRRPLPRPLPVRPVRGIRTALNPQPLPPRAADLARSFPRAQLWQDYQALSRMQPADLEPFIEKRPYLAAYLCRCTSRQVGETALQPGGEFDFCYRRPRRLPQIGQRCWTVFAYRVRQQIGGSWVTVYDGVAGNDWFAAGEEAELRTSHPAARPCGDGPDAPDPGDGTAFVMLEHVTGAGTHHHNWKTQRRAAIHPSPSGDLFDTAPDEDDGLIDFGGVADCPWGGTLGLRLWVSPSLRGTVVHYRLSVVPADASGSPVGTPTLLDTPVAWRYFVPGSVETSSEGFAANPADVGGQAGLFRVPYWADRDWLAGQYHQVWQTADFADGRHILLLELFDGAGNRLKPAGAPASDPGNPAAFQLRRWSSDTATANVPFADCAHLFWLDNRPVEGDIVDIRKDSVPNSSQCQFLSGPAATDIAIGFRAFHLNGVTTGGGPGDTNSFMAGYRLSWQRGLDGPTGEFETGTADRGEGGAVPSTPLDLGFLLGPHPAPPALPVHGSQTRCTFSVHLHVNAKHTTGGGFIDAYDYYETASFALEQTNG